MGLAVISDNTTIKVSQGNIELAASGVSTSTYTVPANAYYMISGYYQPSTGSITIKDGSNTIATISSAAGAGMYGPYYLGEGSTVVFNNTNVSAQTANLVGVEFINTP